MEIRLEMISVVIPTLMAIIEEENIPIEVTIGKTRKEHDGTIMKDILLTYDEDKMPDAANYAVSKAINKHYGLVEE